MTNEEKIELKRKWKNIFLRIEIIIGVIAVIFGIGLTVMVWKEGYFIGALMLVVTGIISIFLGLKELVVPSDNIFHWQSLFFMIVRRAFFLQYSEVSYYGLTSAEKKEMCLEYDKDAKNDKDLNISDYYCGNGVFYMLTSVENASLYMEEFTMAEDDFEEDCKRYEREWEDGEYDDL